MLAHIVLLFSANIKLFELVGNASRSSIDDVKGNFRWVATASCHNREHVRIQEFVKEFTFETEYCRQNALSFSGLRDRSVLCLDILDLLISIKRNTPSILSSHRDGVKTIAIDLSF